MKFSFSDRKVTPFASGVGGIQVSADGSKMVLLSGGGVSIVPTAAAPAPGQGAVNLGALRVKIEPTVEWKRIYDEV